MATSPARARSADAGGPGRSSATPGDHAIVLYDADCGFCRWSVAFLLRRDTRRRLRPVAIQHPEGQALLADLPVDDRLGSAHTIDVHGRRHSDGAWLAAALHELPGGRTPAAVLSALSAAVGVVYGLIARNRTTVSRLVPVAAKRAAQADLDRHAARFGAGDRAAARAHAAR